MSDYVRYLGGYGGVAALAAITAATGAVAYVMSRPRPLDTLVDMERQSKEAPGDDGTRISALCEHNRLLDQYFDDANTLYELFVRGARESSNGPCLGTRNGDEYSWVSYNDVLTRASNLSSGLIEHGLRPVNSTFVGIYSQNRMEFVITQLACWMNSMVIVPLYDTLGPDVCTYIINQAELSLVICDSDIKVTALVNHLGTTPGLKTIVSMDAVSDNNRNKSQEAGVDLFTFAQMEESGKKTPHEPQVCSPDDLCLLCYTSGTTGAPKGAMLTHENIVAAVSGLVYQLGKFVLTPEDVLISYLPLAHVYEIMVEGVMFAVGSRVGFFRGDVKELLDDIAVLRPTVFPTVPRLLNRLHDKVMATVQQGGAIKKCLFNKAMKSKMRDLEKGIIRNNTLWDRLVFKKVQQSLGGRVRLISTGSAPISPKVMNFVRCTAGCPVVEGYGQTETAGITSVTHVGDSGLGHVGPPLVVNLVKLVDVPDKNYFAAKGNGEICVKGHNVFKGYWKNPEKTEEALDDDGWLHTGDIGTWLPNGALKVIDRKKHIFKLAQGEYIAPEKIENIYIRSRHVAQAFVDGDSLKASIVAVVVPDPETVPQWAERSFGITGSMQEICRNKRVKQAIFEDMLAVGKKAELKSFEQVRDIYLHHDLFSVENGLLTPTFKCKRDDIRKFFFDSIEAMYEHLQ